MIYTLNDGRNFCGTAVGAGSCDTDEQDAAINRAQEHLLNKSDWKLTVRRIRIQVCNHWISLPREIEKIIAVTMDHVPVLAQSKYWEFLEGGPGRIDQYTDTNSKDLVDMGNYPCFADIDCDKTRKLVAFSTEEEDEELTFSIRGRTAYNREILTNGIPGETLAINRWKDGVEGTFENISNATLSTTYYRFIDSIVKPVTKGYVTLYAYDPDATVANEDPMLLQLGIYHPDETQPSYRRYRLINKNDSSGDLVIALAKMAHVPLKRANDPLLIQNLEALKFMCQAQHKWDTESIAAGDPYEAKAIQSLEDQLNNYDQTQSEFTVEGGVYALGDVKGVM